MRRTAIAILFTALTAFGAGELSNRRAPGFSLLDSQFQQHDLADYRGKVVLLDFIQTECPNCQKLSATLEAVQRRFGTRIAVLTIANPPSDLNSISRYILQHGVSIPVLMDCGQVAISYFKASPANAQIHVPHVFIIDNQGLIRYDAGWGEGKIDTLLSEEALVEEINKILGERSVEKSKSSK
jgi:peroxiredoxin